MADQRVIRGQITSALSSALTAGEHGLKVVPGLLQRALKEEAWKEHIVEETGELIPDFPSFGAYVVAAKPKGLGVTMETLEAVGHHVLATEAKDQATQRPAGRPLETVDIIHNLVRPSGTSEARALRRLRSQVPELHKRVLAGELSPHRAMVEAGFRHPTVTVPLDDVDRMARTLRKHLDDEQVQELIKQLLASAGDFV